MMIAVVVALFAIIVFTKKFGRIAGMLFLISYFIYIINCFKPGII